MNKPQIQKLTVSNLKVQFATKNGLIKAVDGVSFCIRHGEHVGLIGESGSGKTVTTLSLLGFERGKPGIVAGEIELKVLKLLFCVELKYQTDLDNEKISNELRQAFQNHKILLSQHVVVSIQKTDSEWWIDDEDNNRRYIVRKEGQLNIYKLNISNLLPNRKSDMEPLRGVQISIAFQEPKTMLDPLFSIGQQLAEAIALSEPNQSKAYYKQKEIEWLKRVEMKGPDQVVDQYPHQLSGGMLQRVVLAIALASKPGLLIVDEPTTSLDVTVGSKILLLLKELCQQEGLTLLVISHNLAVIRELAQRVLVMYAGQIVESLEFETLLSGRKFLNPKHPYTQALMASQITEDLIERGQPLRAVEGEVPKPGEEISGCRFHPRCPLKKEKAEAGEFCFANRCENQPPDLRPVAGDSHMVQCWNY